MAVPDTSPIAQYVAKELGALVSDISSNGSVLTITLRAGEEALRGPQLERLRAGIARTFAGRYDQIHLR